MNNFSEREFQEISKYIKSDLDFVSISKKTKKAFDSSLRLGYRIYRKALEKGLMLRPLGDVMYFNPPLVISKEELEEALDICKWAVDEVLDEIN